MLPNIQSSSYHIPVNNMSDNKPTLKLSAFDVNLLGFKKSDYVSEQLTYFVSHGDVYPRFKTDWFKLTSGGIPDFTRPEMMDKIKEPITHDNQREVLYMGLDRDQPSMVAIEKKVVKPLHDFLASNKGKKKIFGDDCRPELYKFSPLYKPEPTGHTDKKTGKYVEWDPTKKYYPRIRMNLACTGGNKKKLEHRNLDTIVVRRDGKKLREEKTVNSVTALAERVKYLSEIRIAFYISRVWQNASMKDGVFEYGVQLKAEYIEYKPNEYVASRPSARSFTFNDSDDDAEWESESESEGDDPLPAGSSVVRLAAHPIADSDEEDDRHMAHSSPDGDEDYDDDIHVPKRNRGLLDEDDEPSTPKKSKKKGKAKTPVVSDSDDEEPIVKSKKGKKKGKANVVFDSDEEDEEPIVKSKKSKPISDSDDEEPIVKSKKSKKNKPKPISDSDDEEPIVKSKKAKKNKSKPISDSEDEEDEPAPVVKSKKSKKNKPKPISDSDDEEPIVKKTKKSKKPVYSDSDSE